jgi:opacity protein-like surface antigen
LGKHLEESVMARSIYAVILLSLSSMAAAQQDGFSYSYLTASYSRADYNDFNADGDGFGIGASVAINEQFHLFGGYAGQDLNDTLDADGWHVGVGFNTPISNVMDVVLRASYVSYDIGNYNDDGFGLGAGVRVAASDQIELNLGLSYVDTDSGNNTALDAGFLFNITDAVAVGVSGSWDDDVDIWSLNGRLYFD